MQEAIGGSTDHFQGSSLSQTVLQSAGGGVIHKEPPSSLSGRLEDTPQFHCGHINVGVCPIKNVSPFLLHINILCKWKSRNAFY